MTPPTHAEDAQSHLKLCWSLPHNDEARPEHLTAALVYAVLAVNDTLEWIAQMIHHEGPR